MAARVKALVAVCLVLSGCSIDSAKSRYLLAEKLWNEKKYAAAVMEFEKTRAKDPRGKIGKQALFRAAMTQALFLNQFGDAIRKLREFAESGEEAAAVWEAEKQIGEILFNKTEQYEEAARHYKRLITKRPDAREAAEFYFRTGKSNFYLWRFNEAVAAYREVIRKFPGSEWAEKAGIEIGMTYFTRGEHQMSGRQPGKEGYQEAMDAFQLFLKKHPGSKHAPEARFGIAMCLEEMDQLDAAYHHYEALRGQYPAPKVIEIKLVRIRERKAQKSR